MNRNALLMVAAAVTAIGTGCEPPGGAARQPIRKYLIFDQTDSVSAQQRALWGKVALQAGATLGPGDAMSVLPMHDRTADAAPLYSVELPPLPARPKAIELTRYRAALNRVKAELPAVVKEALETSVPAKSTDVFSAFTRCESDGRPTLVYLLSDMLHVDKTLNMERERVLPEAFPEIIQSAASRHGWTPNMLRGASVFVVLPDGSLSRTRQINSPADLKAFYSAVIGAVGGRLARFDTHLRKEDLQ